jgi:hypothetical protein
LAVAGAAGKDKAEAPSQERLQRSLGSSGKGVLPETGVEHWSGGDKRLRLTTAPASRTANPNNLAVPLRRFDTKIRFGVRFVSRNPLATTIQNSLPEVILTMNEDLQLVPAENRSVYIPLAADDRVWYRPKTSNTELTKLIEDPYQWVADYTMVGGKPARLADHFVVSLHELITLPAVSEVVVHGIDATALITVRLANIRLASRPEEIRVHHITTLPVEIYTVGKRLYIHRHLGADTDKRTEVLVNATIDAIAFVKDLNDLLAPHGYHLNLPAAPLEVIYEGTEEGILVPDACNINLAVITDDTGSIKEATIETVIVKAYA